MPYSWGFSGIFFHRLPRSLCLLVPSSFLESQLVLYPPLDRLGWLGRLVVRGGAVATTAAAGAPGQTRLAESYGSGPACQAGLHQLPQYSVLDDMFHGDRQSHKLLVNKDNVLLYHCSLWVKKIKTQCFISKEIHNKYYLSVG